MDNQDKFEFGNRYSHGFQNNIDFRMISDDPMLILNHIIHNGPFLSNKLKLFLAPKEMFCGPATQPLFDSR